MLNEYLQVGRVTRSYIREAEQDVVEHIRGLIQRRCLHALAELIQEAFEKDLVHDSCILDLEAVGEGFDRGDLYIEIVIR